MKEAILLLTAAGLLGAAYVSGELQPVFVNDQTGIVWLVCGMGVYGTAFARRHRPALRFLTDKHIPTTLGLLGTFIGAWIMVLSGGDAPGPEDVAGALTAMGTSIAGMSVWIWLLLVREAT